MLLLSSSFLIVTLNILAVSGSTDTVYIFSPTMAETVTFEFGIINELSELTVILLPLESTTFQDFSSYPSYQMSQPRTTLVPADILP